MALIVAMALFAVVVASLRVYAKGASVRKDSREVWAREASRRGLAPANGYHYAGTIEGFAVRLEERRDENGHRMVVIIAGGGMPADMTVLPRSVVATRLFGRRLVTGDQPFDDLFRIPTQSRVVRAALDASTRRLLERNVEIHRCHVMAGAVIAERPHQIEHDDDAQRLLEDALVLARHLSFNGKSEIEQLAAIARDDPQTGARLLALDELLTAYPRAESTEQVVRALVGAGVPPELRLKAALFLGPPGEATLDALLACVDPQVVVQACAALADRGREGMEERLIALLAHDDAEVRVRVAEALATRGSVLAVEPLLACAERAWPVGGVDVGKAARNAVAQIQSRIAGAGAGQVSLASTAEAGAVTMVGRGDGGAVSVAARAETGAVTVAASGRAK